MFNSQPFLEQLTRKLRYPIKKDTLNWNLTCNNNKMLKERRYWQLLVKIVRVHIFFKNENSESREQLTRKLRYVINKDINTSNWNLACNNAIATKYWENNAFDNCCRKLYDPILKNIFLWKLTTTRTNYTQT